MALATKALARIWGSAKETVQLYYANVTSWSSKAKNYLLTRPAHLLMAVEHHQVGEGANTAQDELQMGGWHINWQDATITPEGGTQGGVFIGYRKNLNAFDACKQQTPRWTANLLRLNGRTLLLAVVYLYPGQTATSPQNRQVLAELAGLIQSLSIPYLLVGDWNLEPEQLKESQFTRRIKGHVAATGAATINTGAELDYVIHSMCLVGLVAVQRDLSVPFKPHYGLVVQLSTKDMGIEVPMLKVPTPLSACQGPRKTWQAFEVNKAPSNRKYILGRHGMVDYEATDLLAQWCKQAQDWWNSVDTAAATAERGIAYHFETQKRIPAVRDQIWTVERLNYWGALTRMVEEPCQGNKDKLSPGTERRRSILYEPTSCKPLSVKVAG